MNTTPPMQFEKHAKDSADEHKLFMHYCNTSMVFYWYFPKEERFLLWILNYQVICVAYSYVTPNIWSLSCAWCDLYTTRCLSNHTICIHLHLERRSLYYSIGVQIYLSLEYQTCLFSVCSFLCALGWPFLTKIGYIFLKKNHQKHNFP